MKFKLVLFLLISIDVQFGLTKWNFISKCSFEKDLTHVNYECEDSDKCVEKSDLSCRTLGCGFVDTKVTPKESVVTLKFFNCKVSQLGIRIFETYPLVGLDLSSMDLEILNPSDFHSATQLRTLNASHNRLTEISTEIFINAPKLVQVDLSYNRIDNIVFDQLFNSTDVEIIDFSHNQIRSIENRTFANFLALIELNFEHNLIETIDTDAFAENENLKRVRLDGNRLTEFTCSRHFIIFELNMSHNRLRKFNGNCFVHDSLQINVAKDENQESH